MLIIHDQWLKALIDFKCNDFVDLKIGEFMVHFKFKILRYPVPFLAHVSFSFLRVQVS